MPELLLQVGSPCVLLLWPTAIPKFCLASQLPPLSVETLLLTHPLLFPLHLPALPEICSTTRAVRVCQRSLLLAYVRALGDDGSDPVKRREAFEAAQRVMAEEHAKDQGAGGSAAASSGPASSRPTLRSSLSGRSARHLPRQARAAQGAGRAGGGSNSREQSGSVSNIGSELPATQQPSKQQQQQQHDASHNTLLASAMMVDGGSLAGLLSGGSEQALGHSRGLSLSRRQSARLPDAPPLAAEGSLGQPLGSAGLFDGGGGPGGDGDLGPRIPDMAAYKRACWSMPGRTSATLIQGGMKRLSTGVSSCCSCCCQGKARRVRLPLQMTDF